MSVSLTAINASVSKTTTTNLHLGVAALQVEGDGDYITASESLVGGANMDSLQTMTSGFYPCFKFDPTFQNSSGQPIDVYDSTNQNECAYPTNGSGTWASGTYGTLTNVTFNAGAGGYLSNTSTTAGRNCVFPVATKTGINHTSTTSGRRTICMWIRTSVATPTAFQYIFSDNSDTTSNYSGIIVQYPSNRTNGITWLMGDGAGVGSGDRRSYLGITNTMALDVWNFVVIGAYGGSTISATANYTNITPVDATARNTTNNGASGSSGTFSGYPSYSSSRYPMTHSASNVSQSFVGDVGQIWIFPFYMEASDTRLDDIFGATKQEYNYE